MWHSSPDRCKVDRSVLETDNISLERSGREVVDRAALRTLGNRKNVTMVCYTKPQQGLHTKSCLSCVAEADPGCRRSPLKPPPQPAQISIVVGLILSCLVDLLRVGDDAEVVHGGLNPHLPLPKQPAKNDRVRPERSPVLHPIRTR